MVTVSHGKCKIIHVRCSGVAGAEIETPNASRGMRCGGGVPLPRRLGGLWGAYRN